MKATAIFFRSEFRNSRLDYILQEILERRLGLTFSIVTKDEPLPEGAIAITYGLQGNGMPEFPDSGILRETKISPVTFTPGYENYSLHTGLGDTRNDLFGAAFYLLSRYEEQTSAVPGDEHERFPDSSQLGEEYRRVPMVEFWVGQLRHQLEELGITCKRHLSIPDFSIDWDNPTAFRHKGIWRNSASFLSEILTGKLTQVRKRAEVLLDSLPDPYETLGREIPMELLLGKRIFFWMGNYGKFDKGLSYRNQWYRKQIRELSKIMVPGLHPSYASFCRPEQFLMEKKRLEEILNQSVSASRFHYLRFRLPESYRMLEEAGITDDFSMGFSRFPGFRAGTALPFRWFDLEKNQTGNLLIHPFSLMDSSAAFRGNIDTVFLEEAEKQLHDSRKLGYPVHALFHNEHPAQTGWNQTIAKYLGI